ncbi:transcriptional regulator domain-containing protein [Bradyrhizobium sp. AUGA SZCCT0274]
MPGLLLNRDLAEPSRRAPRDLSASRGPASYDASDWAWEFLRRNPDYCAD